MNCGNENVPKFNVSDWLFAKVRSYPITLNLSEISSGFVMFSMIEFFLSLFSNTGKAFFFEGVKIRESEVTFSCAQTEFTINRNIKA